MTRTRRTLLRSLGTTGLAATVAGCLGSEGDAVTTTDSTTTESTTTEAMTTTERMAGPTVAVASHPDHGEILVDGDGMTLYMFDSDTKDAGASTCYDSCASAWPPLTGDSPEAGDGVTASLSTFERDDGSTQVAANGWPLYYFASDEEPGDASGQGVNDVWWVLAPDGIPIKPSASTTTMDDGSTTTTDGGGGGGGDGGGGNGGPDY